MSDFDKIRPMPPKHGVGFTSETKLPDDLAAGYRYECIGRYHNYHATAQKWQWPIDYAHDFGELVIDGFSPNLNKPLHVGHLRNLAIANSLRHLLQLEKPKFVAMLGAGLGVKKIALQDWEWWTSFLSYPPTVYYDVLMPIDIIDTKKETLNDEDQKRLEAALKDGDKDYRAEVWINSQGKEIKVKRSDGRPLYAYYDLAFAKEVGPSHYITGLEQKERFAELDLGSKHLPMGLVLGEDGKKMKSRSGDAFSANEALSIIRDLLQIEDEGRSVRIAWNIICWNFLHAARETNLKFEAEKWVRTEAPGLYITYTYARIFSALQGFVLNHFVPDYTEPLDFDERDVRLLGLSAQRYYYRHQAIKKMDPAPVANYALELAKSLSLAYEKERIQGGRIPFYRAVEDAARTLEDCIQWLGMFPVTKV